MERFLPEDFVQSNLLFTSDVYKQYANNRKTNFLLCPFSAQVVLALIQSGAKDDTAEELQHLLHLPSNDKTIRANVGWYVRSMKNPNEYQLEAANDIYVSSRFPISAEFKKIAAKDYKADAENMDFSQSGKTASAINTLVEKQTKHQICHIVEPGDLMTTSTVVLINAMCFQARWMNAFPADSTQKVNFYVAGVDEVSVYTMNQMNIFNYYESEALKAKFLELPFEDGSLCLVVVLPFERRGLAALEQKLQMVFEKQEFVEMYISLALPKFRIENVIDIAESLKQLGFDKIFTNEADLSGIAGKKGDLKVGRVLQKAFVEVKEEGVGVAAATDVEMRTNGASQTSLPVDFVVDHPFLFYIRFNDIVILAGRILDPS